MGTGHFSKPGSQVDSFGLHCHFMINYFLAKVGVWVDYLLIYLILESAPSTCMDYLSLEGRVPSWVRQGLSPNPSSAIYEECGLRQVTSAFSFVKVG